MSLPALPAAREALAPHGLAVTGAFAPAPEDGAPDGTGTLALVGADGPAMWQAFRASPEMTDGAPDPLDRWSARVIGEVAAALGATALFPFGGPPYLPFMRWAAKAEGARPSPIGMSVTPDRGLWASWRGALALREAPAMETPALPDPCAGCPAPCLTACPVDAFAGGRYDIPACTAHVASEAGLACRRGGCLARHACPAGAAPAPQQAAFHLAAFLGAHPSAPRRAD